MRQYGEAAIDASTDLQMVSINSTMGRTTLFDRHIASLISHINDLDQWKKFEEIIRKNSKLSDTSKSSIISMIKMLDHPPPSSKAYVSNPMKHMPMHCIISAAPVLLVGKQDGSWRMIVDYKKLNNITLKDIYSLRNMEQALQILGGEYGLFSKLGWMSGTC